MHTSEPDDLIDADQSTEPSLALKIGSIVAPIAAGWLAQKILAAVWGKVTGQSAPLDVDDDDLPVVQAVTFAAVAAAVAVVARRLARKGVARAISR